MITDKLKQFIFNKLNNDLSNTEIIQYNNSIWFIDRKNKYWYLEYQKSGNLYWRWNFFPIFFSLFSLERAEFEPLISEWVEKVLNYGVTTPDALQLAYEGEVEKVLNYGVTTPSSLSDSSSLRVEKVLDYGVTKIRRNGVIIDTEVETVLNYGVTTTKLAKEKPTSLLETILDDGKSLPLIPR